MPLGRWLGRTRPQSGAPGLTSLTATRDEWRSVMEDLRTAGGRLVALWASREGSVDYIRAAALAEPQGFIVSLPVRGERDDTSYPGLDDLFPAATRMQRAILDLSGLRATDADRRPWLRHSAWPVGYHPLTDPAAPSAGRATLDHYEFVRVEGDGVHEIPVGPVHAGTIEPGHFRFSVVGEKVLRLEQRLGYVHKGIEQRFTQLPILEAHRLAARVSGDSAVAYSWAFAQALEGVTGTEVPARGTWLRALCLELERLANHLGDLGALGNDAGFAFGLIQFSRLKELLLRTQEQALGARYLMDAIVPGGVSCNLGEFGSGRLFACVGAVARETAKLRAIYDEHDGLRDRFTGAGTVSPELAVQLGLTGLAGRASGQASDLRIDMPCAPYTELAAAKSSRSEGDVAARVAVRFDEVQESCRLVEEILTRMPTGHRQTEVDLPLGGLVGAGLIEGWRGPVFIALETGEGGTIRRCHPHDPSWQNWPVLEHAVIGNIVPDFPLINKSFNLSYSGHDL
jgi:Ni,Fe-hydrogenase III large subunit/Ni,Fe-hydrogenase III component G